jgi:hypothetical protein
VQHDYAGKIPSRLAVSRTILTGAATCVLRPWVAQYGVHPILRERASLC